MTTPQEKALLEAARDYPGSDAADSYSIEVLLNAVHTYRATLTPPRECRPDVSAKDGSIWWLVDRSGEAEPWKWVDQAWIQFEDAGSASPEFMCSAGWTVHGPCIFPGTGGEATQDDVKAWIRDKWRGPNSPHMVADIQAALIHFRAPKLKINRDDVTDILKRVVGEGKGMPRDRTELDEVVRAVIAKASEGES